MTILDRLDVWAREVLGMDGDSALAVAVEQFYQKTVVHEQLKRYFVDANMEALKRHQVHMRIRYCPSPMRDVDNTTEPLNHLTLAAVHVKRLLRRGEEVQW